MAHLSIDQKFIAIGNDVFFIGFIALREVAPISGRKKVGGEIPRIDLAEWTIVLESLDWRYHWRIPQAATRGDVTRMTEAYIEERVCARGVSMSQAPIRTRLREAPTN